MLKMGYDVLYCKSLNPSDNFFYCRAAYGERDIVTTMAQCSHSLLNVHGDIHLDVCPSRPVWTVTSIFMYRFQNNVAQFSP